MSGDLDQVARWLNATLRTGVGQEQRLRSAISALSAGPRLTGLLRSLLDDPESLAVAAAQSYAHPLGFDKLVLLPAAPAFELRLHVWWPGHDGTVEDLHNHRFSFGSTVLDGALEMQTFTRAGDGVPVQAYEESVGGVGVARLRRVGETTVGCTGTVRLAAGTVYGMSAPDLHRISAAREGLTATLFLRGATASASTTILREWSMDARRDSGRPAMRRAEFAERIDAYLAVLERSNSPSPR